MFGGIFKSFDPNAFDKLPKERVVSFTVPSVDTFHALKNELEKHTGEDREYEYKGDSCYLFLAKNPAIANIIANFLVSESNNKRELGIREIQVLYDLGK